MWGVIVLECQHQLFAVALHKRCPVCLDVSGFVDVADVALKMNVDSGEAQMSCGGRGSVMASMPGECLFRSTGNAAKSLCKFGLAANVVYGALRKVNPVFQRFSCGFTLAPCGTLFLLGGALMSLLLALRGFASFSRLFFADCAGALVAANDLSIADRMEPLPAFFVGALAAR